MEHGDSSTRGRAPEARRLRLWRLLLASAVFAAALQLANTEVVTRAFATALETSFSRPSLGHGSALTGIVVLGGGDERLREAGRLVRMYGQVRLVVSGGGEIGQVRRQLGHDIAPHRIEIEDRSRTTFENALYTKASIQPGAGERWLLVTSAAHMPRAIGAFRSVGFEVEPWPVHDLGTDNEGTASVLQHEALGLLWYWLLGRSNELFPQP